MRLAVTGHRPPKLGGYYQPNRVSSAVQEALFRWFNSHLEELEMVYLGMAVGTDQWAAEACVSLNIPFFACVPFQGYESRWPPRVQQHYQELLSHAADTAVVTPRQEYRPQFLQRRNEWMVDRADQLLAVFDGVRYGGTWNCISYAERTGKPWVPLHLPEDVWDEARRITTSMAYASPENAIGRRAPTTLYGGLTPEDATDLRIRQQEAMANAPRDTPAIPPPPMPAPQEPSGFATLFRRRRRFEASPVDPTQRITLDAVQRARIAADMDNVPRDSPRPTRRDLLYAETERRSAESSLTALGVPARFLPQPLPPPTQEHEKKVEEVHERFKPGRTLELDDD